MRYLEDKIWGFWPADEKSLYIWKELNKLIQEYGLELDIIYDDPTFSYQEKYSKIYPREATIN